jgi:hypothetical protein
VILREPFDAGLPVILPYAKLLASALLLAVYMIGNRVAPDTDSWLVVRYGKLIT